MLFPNPLHMFLARFQRSILLSLAAVLFVLTICLGVHQELAEYGFLLSGLSKFDYCTFLPKLAADDGLVDCLLAVDVEVLFVAGTPVV